MFKWLKKNKNLIIAFLIYLTGCCLLMYTVDTFIEFLIVTLGMCMIDNGKELIKLEI